MASRILFPDLSKIYKQMAKCFPSDGNYVQERLIYENVQCVATEPWNVSYEDVWIVNLPCKWIRPLNASATHVMLYMHGGGYTMGSPEGHRKLTGHLAKACNCIALSVDYRRAPEHKYPAALEDCVNVYKWLLEHGFRPEHIVLAGDFSGGGLATAVPLAALREGLPQPGASVCLSPWYDLMCSGQSMVENKHKDTLNTRPFLEMLADRYVEGSGVEKTDPLVSPLYADMEDLKRLPPHWICVGEFDILRDDGIRMAKKAEAAGLQFWWEEYRGQQHVFQFMAGNSPEADESIGLIGSWVRQMIGNNNWKTI